MSRWHGYIRLLIGLWAVLQVAAAPMLALIDGAAALDESAVATAAHVEGHSTSNCHRPHVADCPLCQFLSTHAANARTGSSLFLVVRHDSVGLEGVALAPTAFAGDLAQSRAPPMM